MGRRKIAIKPILNDRNRSVTFVKRKNGLFKKAFELGVLCSVDVAVIIFEERAGGHVKLHEYCSTDVDTMVQRHLSFDGERESKRPIDFNKNTGDDDGDGPEDEEVEDDEDPRAGGSSARRPGGGSGAGTGYGSGPGFQRLGQSMGGGARSLSSGEHGSFMGAASSSRSGGMNMGFDAGYKPSVSVSYSSGNLPPHSHPSLQNASHPYSHPPAYGSTTSNIPFSQERGAGNTYGGYTPTTKRPRLDSIGGYPGGPSPYTIDHPYVQHQPHQHQSVHSPQQDSIFGLGTAFGRPTPSPSSATGSHTGGGRGSVYQHGSTSPHHGGSFVGMLGDATSPPSSGTTGRGTGQQSSFAWPMHSTSGTADSSSASHNLGQQTSRSAVGAGGGGGGAAEAGWLDFLSNAPAHTSGAGASPVQPGASTSSAASSGHQHHAPQAHPSAPAPMPETTNRLGKRTRSQSFADEGYRDDEGIPHPRERIVLKQEDTSDLGPSGANISHNVRARVDTDLESVFGLGRNSEEDRVMGAGGAAEVSDTEASPGLQSP